MQSESFKSHIANHGVQSDRIRYLPNTAESFYEPLDRSLAHEVFATIPNGTRILFAGNIGVAQDFGTILAAAELTRNCRSLFWLIAGDGRMREWVEQEITKRNLTASVMLLGRFPATDMSRLFAGVDGLLATLQKKPIFALTIPSKIQSYLACGKPVIAALDGAGADVLRESRAGLCVPAEDSLALAAAAMTLHEMKSHERAVMGVNAREYFDAHFHIDRHLEQLEKLIIEVTK
jgi:glycosyltransferase involved in cell wall biosynthesis